MDSFVQQKFVFKANQVFLGFKKVEKTNIGLIDLHNSEATALHIDTDRMKET